MSLTIDFAGLQLQKAMVQDQMRCDAFRRALAGCVAGKVVLDIGAGTGILSLLAAQAGARQVYAVERTAVAELPRRLVADNGFERVVAVYHADMAQVQLPQKVDVIVSEWLGGYGLDEGMLPVIVAARDRWLKVGGSLLPAAVSSWLAPAYDMAVHRELEYWRKRPYDLNWTAIAEQSLRQQLPCRNHVREAHLASPGQRLWTVDCASITPRDAVRDLNARLTFTVDKPTRVNVLATWFEADLGPGNVLSNRPSQQYCHWGRLVFPFDEAVDVVQNTRIEVQFGYRWHSEGNVTTSWDVQIDDRHYQGSVGTRVPQCAGAK